MERAVLDQLASYFRARLAGYPTTLDEDESMVLIKVFLVHILRKSIDRLWVSVGIYFSFQLADSSLDPKKRVATQLVRLEKKVLGTCLKVIVDLIAQLPDNTVSPCPAPYAPILKWKAWFLVSSVGLSSTLASPIHFVYHIDAWFLNI